jgi:GDP-L-fucose synthase
VLVTGGNGFIGSHLVELLVSAGARVVSTASSEASRWRFLDAVRHDVETRVGDLRDREAARRAVEGQEIVLHLAARVGGIAYNIAHPASIFRDNLDVFMNVLEASRVAGAGRFLVVSSACVYPRFCSVPTPEAEGFHGRPEPSNEGYGWAKRMEEFLGEAYTREYGMDVRIARPYNAYGPRDNFDPATSHVIPALIRRVLTGENPLVVWGDGTATRSFLYVSDFARGLTAVAERSPQVEAINVGSDEETSVRTLAELIVELSGRQVEIVFDTAKPGGQPRRTCDTSLAKRLLGFEAEVPLREGVRRTMEWYRRTLAATSRG